MLPLSEPVENMMITPDRDTSEARDWARQPMGIALLWVLPVLVGVATNFLSLPISSKAFIWAGAFAWMGTGCLLNARRCSRLHCFISGPVLWVGAVAVGLVGAGVLSGSHALNNVVSITTVLAVLSCVPEMIWGRYARHGGS